jgi:hypothetical protein
MKRERVVMSRVLRDKRADDGSFDRDFWKAAFHAPT